MNEPTVSIVIPARNEARHIARCLDSILSQDYPRGLTEVLVVDGMSSDRTRDIVRGYCERHPRVKLVDNPNRTAPSGVNIGIRAATGEILMRADAHSEYPSDYARRCVELLVSTGAANAGGRIIPVPNGTGVWARPIARLQAHRFGVGNGAFRTRATPGFVDTVPFGTFRREIFDEIGFFDERLTRNQDNELNARLVRAGYKIAYDPGIRIDYKNKETLSELSSYAFNSGMWNVYTQKLHPHAFQARRFVPALFVLYLFTLAAAGVLPAALRRVYALPLAAYALLCAVSAADRRFSAIENLRMAVVFCAHHVSYGFGTAYGAVNLLTGRWRYYLGRPRPDAADIPPRQ